MAGRPGNRPKKGVGFANVYSMNNRPPPKPPVQQPAQPPRNDRPNVPPPPPEPKQGGLPAGPNNPRPPPTLAPPPFSGPRLVDTGIFSGTGIRHTEIDKWIDEPESQKTPSKTDQDKNQVDPAVDDAQLMKVFRDRIINARGGKTVEERKNELREAVEPWMEAGLTYSGPKRPGLYLPDGTRNPARPARGTTIPASPGKPPSSTAKAPKGTKAPEQPGKVKKSSTSTGKKGTEKKGTGKKGTEKKGTGDKTSTGTGNNPSTGTKAPAPPPASKEPKPLPTTGKDLLSGTGKSSSSGIRKGSKKGNKGSPLSNPPIRPEDLEDVVDDTPTGTDRAGWRRRDDLFDKQVMKAAKVSWFSEGEKPSALPQLPSTIDYNTENWE